MNIKVETVTPKIPDELRIKGTSMKFSIADFSDAELKEVGESWTRELVERARELRKEE